MDTKTRKTEIDLVTLGTGMIFFGAWTFIKLILTTLLYDTELFKDLPDVVTAIVYIIIFYIAGIAFLIHFYIGMSARAEGKGKRKTVIYIILTGVIIFLGVPELTAEAYLLFTENHSLLHIIVTLIIEVTSLVITLELFVNAIRLRRLRKKEAQA